MWLDEAAVIGRQDFTHLECRDVFMWNVLSTQRCLSTFCSISLALSLPVLSRSLLTPSTRLTSLFCPIKTLMGSISCAPRWKWKCDERQFFSSVWLKGSCKHLPPHLAHRCRPNFSQFDIWPRPGRDWTDVEKYTDTIKNTGISTNTI